MNDKNNLFPFKPLKLGKILKTFAILKTTKDH